MMSSCSHELPTYCKVRELRWNVETIIATSGDDVLGGDELANTLMGEAGDDIIRGGGGSDVLSGGDGDDQLRFDDLDADGIILSLETNTATKLKMAV